MSKSELLRLFNKQFDDFIKDIITAFPNDREIKLAKNAIIAIRNVNCSLVIKIWHKYIGSIYKNEIEHGNIDFFLNKDYGDDLQNSTSSGIILSKISVLREPISKLDAEN